MKFTPAEIRTIPRATLEQLQIAPMPRDDQDETARIYVFSAWDPNDDERRQAAESFLREYVPDGEFEFVRPIEDNPDGRIRDLLAATFATPSAQAETGPTMCSECEEPRARVIQGRDASVCERCLSTAFVLSEEGSTCSLCARPSAPFRKGRRVVMCEGCYQLAKSIVRSPP